MSMFNFDLIFNTLKHICSLIHLIIFRAYPYLLFLSDSSWVRKFWKSFFNPKFACIIWGFVFLLTPRAVWIVQFNFIMWGWENILVFEWTAWRQYMLAWRFRLILRTEKPTRIFHLCFQLQFYKLTISGGVATLN